VRPRRAVAMAIGVIAAVALVTPPASAQGRAEALTIEARGVATLLPQNEARQLGANRTVVFDDERIDVEATVRAGGPAALAAIGSVLLQRRDAGATSFVDWLPLQEAATARPKAAASATYAAHRLAVPLKTDAIRVAVRRQNGSLEASPLLRTEAHPAPRVLTLIAMGGSCTDPDANTSFKDLADARIVRDTAACEQKSVPATFLGDLTPMASVNCNDLCNAGCTNFIEHLALRLLNANLANDLQSVNNPGTEFCHRRTNANGIANKIVIGKWRNTEQEGVCGTSVTFNKLIDTLRDSGNGHVILIGQSQGGAKFADMVRDHWRWADAVSVDLYVSWDASSFTGVPTFVSNTACRGSLLGEPCTSMGTRSVGSRPKKVLHFFQYHDPIPFQNGAPIAQATEAHDLNVCFSHNAIARSQFVHRTTADAVAATLRAIRDGERQ
jgi:hypothetical protein